VSRQAHKNLKVASSLELDQVAGKIKASFCILNTVSAAQTMTLPSARSACR